MTAEKTDSDKDYVLLPSGRFAHTKSYLESVLQNAGFENLRLTETFLREENGVAVGGFVVMAEKTVEKSN